VKPLARAMRRAQRGAVLFIALIVLVAMSLAGLALMRGVDTGTLIASNLAFKQGATMAGDWGVEQGRGWLMAPGAADLKIDQPALGYFATLQETVDVITGLDWSTALNIGTDAAGNQVSYFIHRLCDLPGDPAAVNCVKSTTTATAAASTKGAGSYSGGAISIPTSAFYRITVRVVGPRNTTSFVQATVF
jgi:type IV pilus assembly protein PilX